MSLGLPWDVPIDFADSRVSTASLKLFWRPGTIVLSDQSLFARAGIRMGPPWRVRVWGYPTPPFGTLPNPSSGEPTLVAENDGARPPEQLQRGRGHAESIGTYPGETQGHPYPLCCGLAGPKRPQESPSIFGYFLVQNLKIRR